MVLCAGTIPRASFRERVAAATAGGFDGVSLRLRDYTRARADGLSDADMRALLAGEGMAVAEVEALTAWRPGTTPSRSAYAAPRVLEIAEALRARSISVVEGPGAPLPMDAAAEAFAALCDGAAALELLVGIEFWPGSGLDLRRGAGGGRRRRSPERWPARRHLAPGANAGWNRTAPGHPGRAHRRGADQRLAARRGAGVRLSRGGPHPAPDAG